MAVSATVLPAAVPWGVNLLENGSGEKIVTDGWTVTAAGGSGWTRSETGGYDAKPGYFATSFAWCRRSQTVDLVAAGATAAELDSAPAIQVGEAISSYLQGAPDRYYLKVELRGENQEVIAEWSAGSYESGGLEASNSWVEESHEFTDYGPGVRYVYFEDGGIDTGYWAGYYGTYHDAAFVKFRSPDLELDTDQDGMPDVWETAHQLNKDDPADAGLDPDNDGLSNLEEFTAGSDPRKGDTDGDGLPDAWEVQEGTQPAVADAGDDPDGDGLSNLEEYNRNTLPLKWDSDADAVSDGAEIRLGTDPLDPGSVPAFDYTPVVLAEDFDGAASGPAWSFQSIQGGYAASVTASGDELHGNAARLTVAGTGDTRNALVWDYKDARADSIRLSFDFRLSTGAVADGFGIGLFLTSQWGESGPLVNDALATAAWEDPSTEGGIPGAVYFGFDVYTNSSGKNIRLSGPERPGVALHDVTDLELSGASFLNSGLFHRAIITATAAGPDATNVKLEIIPNVNDAGSTLVAIPDKIVKGFNLLEDPFRLAAAARTGGVTVSTDLDNFTLEASGLAGGVTPPPPSSFAISSITFGAASASLTWPSAAGKSYAVERSEDLSAWTHPETVSGTGESTTHTYTLPATLPSKLFLRVRELP